MVPRTTCLLGAGWAPRRDDPGGSCEAMLRRTCRQETPRWPRRSRRSGPLAPSRRRHARTVGRAVRGRLSAVVADRKMRSDKRSAAQRVPPPPPTAPPICRGDRMSGSDRDPPPLLAPPEHKFSKHKANRSSGTPARRTAISRLIQDQVEQSCELAERTRTWQLIRPSPMAASTAEVTRMACSAERRMSRSAWDLGDGPERLGYAATSCPAGWFSALTQYTAGCLPLSGSGVRPALPRRCRRCALRLRAGRRTPGTTCPPTKGRCPSSTVARHSRRQPR